MVVRMDDDDDGDSKSVNLGQNAISFGNFDFSFKNKNSTFQLRLQTLFRNQGDGFVAKSPHANHGIKKEKVLEDDSNSAAKPSGAQESDVKRS